MKNILHVFSIIDTAEAFFDGQFSYLGGFGFSVHMITSPSPRTAGFCRNNKTQYAEVIIPRAISPLKDIRALIAMSRYIKKEQIQTVVGHTPKGALLSMISGFIMRVPQRIYYRHGLIYTTKKGVTRAFLKSMERFISALATDIIDVSPSVGDLCVKDGINKRDKQQLIGKGSCGGIDCISKFNPETIDRSKLQHLREQLKIEEDAFVVGFAGRICRDKGIEELVGAFSLLVKRNPEKKLVLLLTGDHDTRDHLDEKIIAEISSNPHIIKTGWVSSEEMKYYYSLMSVFVLPSYREGFGMSVIEASALEIPVLVSKSHGCVDTIVENKTGCYIEISEEGIAEGITGFFEPEVRAAYGKEGRAWVVENFDHSVLWTEVIKIYQ